MLNIPMKNMFYRLTITIKKYTHFTTIPSTIYVSLTRSSFKTLQVQDLNLKKIFTELILGTKFLKRDIIFLDF